MSINGDCPELKQAVSWRIIPPFHLSWDFSDFVAEWGGGSSWGDALLKQNYATGATRSRVRGSRTPLMRRGQVTADEPTDHDKETALRRLAYLGSAARITRG
jgi:hypothetical protein